MSVNEDARARDGDARAEARSRMVEEIEAMVRETRTELGRDRLSDRVLAALRRVPRHRFVPAAVARSAYDNRPLPIGEGQTISQPFIVATMTDLLDLEPHHTVLEIGTGSGYQAAVLGELVRRVVSVEIVEPLGRQAAATLAAEGYRNVEVVIGDGYRGWPQGAPYDAIIVTAAAPHVPSPLVEQLRPGGRMVIPVGAPHGAQEFLLLRRHPDGNVTTRVIMQVRFVPLTGGHGR